MYTSVIVVFGADFPHTFFVGGLKIIMKHSTDLGKDPVSSLVFRLAIPAMIAQFVNVLYSTSLTVCSIGHIPKIGELALAGVGVCGPIVTLLSSFGTLVGLGGSILLGIRLGEKNFKKAEQISVKLVFNAVCHFHSAYNYLSSYEGQTSCLVWRKRSHISLCQYLHDNLHCRNLFCPYGSRIKLFYQLSGVPSCRNDDCAHRTTISNIILDPVFIFLFHMDVAGAAIATVISQMASCTFAILFLFSKKVHVPISFGNYNRRLMLNIVYLGLSPFLILATDSFYWHSKECCAQKYGGPGPG